MSNTDTDGREEEGVEPVDGEGSPSALGRESAAAGDDDDREDGADAGEDRDVGAHGALLALVAMTRDPTAAYIGIFAVIALAALAAMTAGPSTDIPLLILVPLLLVFVLIAWRVWSRERLRKTVETRRPWIRLLSYEAGLLLVLVLTAGVAHSVGAIQKLLPAYFPKSTAKSVIEAWVHDLSDLLAAESEEQRVEAFRSLGAHMSPRMRKSNLPNGAAEELAASVGEATDRLVELSGTYRSWYGNCNQAQLETIAAASWRPSERETLYLLAVIGYRGRFIHNEAADLRLTPLDIKNTVDNPNSIHFQRLHAWVRSVFPDHDERELWEQMQSFPVADLLEDNAADLLAYRLREYLGEPSKAAYRFGTELTLCSIRMIRSKSGEWLIDEIGRWSLKRIFTDERSTSVDPSEPAVEASYEPQIEGYLCQSAALSMLFSTLQDEQYGGGQTKLYAVLSAETFCTFVREFPPPSPVIAQNSGADLLGLHLMALPELPRRQRMS